MDFNAKTSYSSSQMDSASVSKSKFDRIQTKFRNLLKEEIPTAKINSISNKVEEISKELSNTSNILETKHSTLKDYVNKLTSIIEAEKTKKQSLKENAIQTIKGLYNKANDAMIRQNEEIRVYVDSKLKSIELKIERMTNESFQSKQDILKIVKEVRMSLDTDIPELNVKSKSILTDTEKQISSLIKNTGLEGDNFMDVIHSAKSERDKIEFDFIERFLELTNNVKLHLEDEVQKRKVFEHNIMNVLNATTERIDQALKYNRQDDF